MSSKKSEFIQLWKLGETAVRNPYRITGALKIFKMFFDGGDNFSGSNSEPQFEFMEKLLKYTEDGKEITNRDSNQIPIADYPEIEKKEKKQKKKDKQQKARYWTGVIENMGLFNVFTGTIKLADNGDKTSLTDVGQLFLNYPELRNEIWLKQILKRQFPNHKKPNLPLNIRGGWWLIKLILELDGLTRWELSLASTIKEENLTFMKKLIQGYRKKRRGEEGKNQLCKLKEEYELKAVKKWFKEDFTIRKKELFRIIKKTEKDSGEFKEKEIDLKLQEIIKTQNSKTDKLPVSTRKKIIQRLEKGDYDKEKHLQILDEWYHSMKRRTIFVDYKDSNSRVLERTGFIMKVVKKSDGGVGGDSFRLRVLDQDKEFINHALNNVLPIKKLGTDEKIKNYYKYLVDINQPSLETDDLKYLGSRIKEMKIRLKKLGFPQKKIKKLEKNGEKNPLINKKIVFYKLLNKIKAMDESNFISNMDRCIIENKILELEYLLNNSISSEDIKSEIRTKPIFMEEVIWYAIGRLGGFVKHVSETRNFHVDSEFRAVFTAAGKAGVGDESLPDMEFHYKDFDEVVEVTTSNGKTQWRMEGDPVPKHVAEHQFYHQKRTNGLFIAPTLHDETVKEFARYSHDDTTYDVKKTQEKIHIIPLTINEFSTIWKKCISTDHPSKSWIEIISKLHKLSDSDPDKWREKIKQCVTDV